MATSDSGLGRNQFLNLAGAFQGGMVLVALGLAWVLKVDPWNYVAWNADALMWGVFATLPLCGVTLLLLRSRVPALRRLTGIWLETLGPVLVECRWWELVILSLLVGISEELLFRGVLQVWLMRWSLAGALVLTNLLFAVAHALSPAYAFLAGSVGLYLGCLMLVAEPPNLVIPILCHAGSDLFSFWCLRRRVLRDGTASSS